MGATAALEAVITVLALKRGIIPANINLFTPDPDLPPLQLPTETVEKRFDAALSNSFGFGGHNSALLLGAV